MPKINPCESRSFAQGETAVNQPWLSFFREVRRLAEKLDELEQKGMDRERLSR